jgi:lysophospholipase L1-like esterase
LPLRWLRDAWLIAGLTAVLLVSFNTVLLALLPDLEAANRIDPAVTERPARDRADCYHDARWAKELFREQKKSKRVRWQPYVHWQRQPFRGEYINIDENGRRVTQNPSGTESPRVFVFGGSTVWGTGVRDAYTIPSLLSGALEEIGRPAHVTNFGETGYVSTQALIALVRELQAHNVPEFVVFYDGANDVFAAVQEGAAGLPQNEQERRREFRVVGGSPLRLLLAAFWKLEGLHAAVAWLRGDVEGTETPARYRALADEIVATYAANVRTVAALAREWDFEALFYWQPTSFTRRALTAYERRATGWQLSRHRDLQLMTNRSLRTNEALAAIPVFHDVSALLDDVAEPMFIDFCHLGERANGLVAARIAVDVARALRERAAKRAAGGPRSKKAGSVKGAPIR